MEVDEALCEQLCYFLRVINSDDTNDTRNA